MNSLIWRNLPSELIHKIVLLSDPSIDTRLYFGIPPRKLNEYLVRRIGWLLATHDGIFYNRDSKSLHILRMPGCHVIHRPINLDANDEWFSIFNQNGNSHTLETTTIDGIHVTTSNATFYTELRVLLVD